MEFKKPYDNQIPGWVKYIAGTLGLEIAEDAIVGVRIRNVVPESFRIDEVNGRFAGQPEALFE